MWQCVSIKEVSCNQIRLDGALLDSVSLCFKRVNSRSSYSLAASPSSSSYLKSIILDNIQNNIQCACVSINEVSCNRIRLDGALPDSASLCFKRGHSRSFYSLAASPSSHLRNLAPSRSQV